MIKPFQQLSLSDGVTTTKKIPPTFNPNPFKNEKEKENSSFLPDDILLILFTFLQPIELYSLYCTHKRIKVLFYKWLENSVFKDNKKLLSKNTPYESWSRYIYGHYKFLSVTYYPSGKDYS